MTKSPVYIFIKKCTGEIYILSKFIVVFIGGLLFSIGINGFLVPHHLLDGGIEGLALILHYYFDVPTGITMFLLSIPICIYTWFYNSTIFYNSFLGLLGASIMIDCLAPLRHQFMLPIFPSTLLGGLFIGTGVGLMLRYMISTGGTDLLALIISEILSKNIGLIILLIDTFIVSIGFFTMDIKTFLFSCLTIAIIGAVTSILAKS